MEDQVSKAMGLLPDDTKTAIDRHTQAGQIKEALVLYELTPMARRISLPQLTEELKDEYGVELTEGQVKHYLQRYVVPALYVPPAYVRKGLSESGQDLNLPLRKLKIAQSMENYLDEVKSDPSAKPADVATVSRAAIEALSRSEESLERWQVIPQRRSENVSFKATLDMNKAMETLGGESPPEPQEPAGATNGETIDLTPLRKTRRSEDEEED